MSLPYFPMYPTDFEADTSHLTLEEDGAYNRLLRLMWMTPNCSLPNDPKWIMRRMRISQQIYDDVVRVIIDEFMTISKGRIINKRLKKEYGKTVVAKQKRVHAGKLGGEAKALKTKEMKSSKAVARARVPEPEPYIEKDIDKSISKKKKPIEELLEVLPEEIAQAVVDHRKSIRKPLTAYASKLLAGKFNKTGQPEAAAKMMIANGWQGFEVGWFQNQVRKSNGNGNGQYKTKADRNQDSVDKAREWFNEMQDKPQPPKMKAIN